MAIMLFLGLKMNNKNIIELEEIFHNIVNKHNLEIHCGGINNGKIFLEDGLPWVELYGSFDKVSAKSFLQELSNEMNINIIFNRLESDIKDKSTLYAILDISPAFVFSQNKIDPVPANSADPDAKEFMEDYGSFILPKQMKRKM